MNKNKIKSKLSRLEDETESDNTLSDDFNKLFIYRTDKLINMTRSEENKKDLGPPPDVPKDVEDAVDDIIKIKES